MGQISIQSTQEKLVEMLGVSDDQNTTKTNNDSNSHMPEKDPPKPLIVIDLNTTSEENPPPTIFHCGLQGNGMSEVAPTMAVALLPEYQFQELKPKRPGQWLQEYDHKPMRPYDIFLSPLSIACVGSVERWLQRTFAGQIVYITGESSTPPSRHSLDRNHMVYLGPVPENYHPKAIRLYYLQWVWWQLFYKQGHDELLHRHLKPQNTGKQFLIYAANNCVPFRDQAFAELASIAPVHHGGRCRGTVSLHPNVSAVQTNVRLSNWWDNVRVYRDYRFCLVMEHSMQEGYVTEKILMAFQAGCIPIYYGPPTITDLFHQDSFIMYDIDNPQSALTKIRLLNENQTAYQEMLLQSPILAQGNATIEKYFSFSESVGGGMLKKRIRSLIGLDQYKFVQ
ncbi:hypothetical protein ACA910_000252 [Epithemia clementina (nom. ined.)]